MKIIKNGIVLNKTGMKVTNMYSISQLGKLFKLSRGTLIYYDAIGLLKPSTRTEANYRCYSEADAERLREICRYRETGMPLEDIQELLNVREKGSDRILEKRLDDLNRDIRKLNLQRQIITHMLKKAQHASNLSKERFKKVLENSGFNDDELTKLHAEYEKEAPEEHQAFLEFMGFSPEEITEIREFSRKVLLG